MSFLREVEAAEAERGPRLSNLAFGNPQDLPMRGYVDALQHAAEPEHKDWFAYTLSDPGAQRVVAESLRAELGLPFDPEDIAMTSGAFGALAAALLAIVDPGDEVVMNLPPWFFYEAMIVSVGGVPVKVTVDRETLDLDLGAIEAAMTPRTRAIIVNTPNNPTGRVYPPETLERLATILAAASERNGRPIWLISDEPYRKLRFYGAPFTSPLSLYPYAMMIYSYGKILLTPGQRMGYLALPPTLPERRVVRDAIMTVQVAGGWLFPNALLQHAIAELEPMTIDLSELARKRDHLVTALREIGYEVHAPEGTFYLLPRSPWADDHAFTRVLIEHDILSMPGAVMEFPGFFRLSLTASETMIDRSLPGFAAAFAHATTHPAPVSATATVGVSR
ncbi:aminotransferase class I/II-fold pyridoxal phosphate-dependent enzyme [Ornithinimicrobium sediminis]|uniref:aminotransferase class I/II-fold pyridoxal phosphate-dependent enzyme n=1 Tax=Ornithinimicrobium sediminis TaxID=2904603 RepID=UPI001E2A1B22|nr:aminotransferase class I/II-fold pyridoxal phosphate-dependent enzyme [Ornithinimicrobium sediminis]MCE0487397.1 aminotransferase class I/II-fold pyridoxal phosphate-dependent enzyme [Ornithinimicrobium sediminis]